MNEQTFQLNHVTARNIGRIANYSQQHDELSKYLLSQTEGKWEDRKDVTVTVTQLLECANLLHDEVEGILSVHYVDEETKRLYYSESSIFDLTDYTSYLNEVMEIIEQHARPDQCPDAFDD